MPISTNAPFNEFGMSQVLRDIEQLYLALNGPGTGSSGDGQTQEQSVGTNQDPQVVNGIDGDAGPPGPQGPQGEQGEPGTIPLGPGGETMSIITVQACVDGVTKTMYIYGYVVP